jgi:hypothetical protein
MPTVKRSGLRKKRIKSKRKEQQEDLDSLVLPTEANVPSDDFDDYTFFIFGKKGMGKTELTAQFKDPISFHLERNRFHLGIRQVPAKGEKAMNWKRFLRYFQLALEDDSIHTIAIDTVDKLWEMALQEEVDEAGLSGPMQTRTDGLNTWIEASKRYESTLNLIKEYGKTAVYISHGKFKDVEDPLNDSVITVLQPTLADRPWSYFQQTADYVFCYTTRGMERVLVVRPTDTLWASCGPENTFMHPKSGKPLLYIPSGGSAKQAYRNLCKGFANECYGVTIPDPKGEKKKKKKSSDD